MAEDTNKITEYDKECLRVGLSFTIDAMSKTRFDVIYKVYLVRMEREIDRKDRVSFHPGLIKTLLRASTSDDAKYERAIKAIDAIPPSFGNETIEKYYNFLKQANLFRKIQRCE